MVSLADKSIPDGEPGPSAGSPGRSTGGPGTFVLAERKVHAHANAGLCQVALSKGMVVTPELFSGLGLYTSGKKRRALVRVIHGQCANGCYSSADGVSLPRTLSEVLFLVCCLCHRLAVHLLLSTLLVNEKLGTPFCIQCDSGPSTWLVATLWAAPLVSSGDTI